MEEKDSSEIQYAPDVVIKVVGVGGGGGNALNRMIDSGIKGVDYIAVNTDAMVLGSSRAPVKVQIGQKLTNGRGAGGKPEVGEKSAEENKEEISAAIRDANMVFIAAGMGGGTGTGAAPVVASIAQEMGILTVGVVTKPFGFEGRRKMEKAEKGIAELKEHVDALIVIPNARLLDISERKLTVPEAFALSDDTLKTSVKAIAEIVTVESYINVDFADVEATLKGAGYAHMAVGTGQGKDKVSDALNSVVSSPLLETSISGARRLLLNVTFAPDVYLEDVNDLAEKIEQAAAPDVDIIFGSSPDETLDDAISVTVIAAGFDDSDVVNVDNQVMKNAMEEFNKAKVGAGAALFGDNPFGSSSSSRNDSPLYTFRSSDSSSNKVNDDDDLLSMFKNRK
ncbi:MAG: cell division protein FtsZ [Oscillospiraceae bacterium]|nr:cell division protein FtsZ [Oscillospiraceae bacterium]MCR5167983.1 cell division protein FtsZ [Oscillospiraceae bacterium]